MKLLCLLPLLFLAACSPKCLSQDEPPNLAFRINKAGVPVSYAQLISAKLSYVVNGTVLYDTSIGIYASYRGYDTVTKKTKYDSTKGVFSCYHPIYLSADQNIKTFYLSYSGITDTFIIDYYRPSGKCKDVPYYQLVSFTLDRQPVNGMDSSGVYICNVP